NFAHKIELLETLDVADRLKLALRFQQERLTELHVRQRIRDEVESGTQKQQREYFLRRQMDAIRKELGENEGSIIEEYRQKIADAHMPEPVQKQAERELARLEKMGESNAEASMIRTYLDWLLAVPWSKRSEERLDPKHARGVLDADHAGLDDVKRRITEYLAVRKLRAERHLTDSRRSGAILTLIGPPGTGKTSIGESIARATGRKFVRMSLGGVRDEAEIRGHRRTYIGALPGRLVRALRDAGTMNPVIMLDEVDKIGADWRGDPSSALLEVLDPAQTRRGRRRRRHVPTRDRRVHARGGRATARARAGHALAEDRDRRHVGRHAGAGDGRRRARPRGARAPEVLPGSRDPDGGSRRGHRPRGDRHRRRRPLRGGRGHAGLRGSRADGSAR